METITWLKSPNLGMSIFCHLWISIYVWTVFGKYLKSVNAIRAHVSHCDSWGFMRNNHFVLLNTVFQCWTMDFLCKTSCWLLPLIVHDAYYSNILGKDRLFFVYIPVDSSCWRLYHGGRNTEQGRSNSGKCLYVRIIEKESLWNNFVNISNN